MKFTELKDKTVKELQDMLPVLAQESMNLRFRKQVADLEDISRMKKVKRQVARVKMLLHRHQVGCN